MAAIEATLPVLEDLGAEILEVELPHIEDAFKAGTLTILSEGATYHADHLRTRLEAFSPQCRADSILGRLYKATDYIQAQRLRRHLMNEAAKVMAPLDALVMPTSPITGNAGRRQSAGSPHLSRAQHHPLQLPGPARDVTARRLYTRRSADRPADRRQGLRTKPASWKSPMPLSKQPTGTHGVHR